MDKRRIGVFDSGLGGLTVVKELSHILPDESIVYFGDTGRVPYGTKSKETIIRYTTSDINFLRTFDLKMIVAACGTASAMALPEIKDKFDIPVIGVVEPTVKAALAATRNKIIGVIATRSTIKSNAYGRLIRRIDEDAAVINKSCPLFVPLVENDYTHGTVACLVAQDYLKRLKDGAVDTVIMGCTHYPLLEPVIREIMGDSVKLINSGRETALYIKDYLTENDMLTDRAEPEPGRYRYYVSDEPELFSKISTKFLGCRTTESVKKVDIENF